MLQSSEPVTSAFASNELSTSSTQTSLSCSSSSSSSFSSSSSSSPSSSSSSSLLSSFSMPIPLTSPHKLPARPLISTNHGRSPFRVKRRRGENQHHQPQQHHSHTSPTTASSSLSSFSSFSPNKTNFSPARTSTAGSYATSPFQSVFFPPSAPADTNASSFTTSTTSTSFPLKSPFFCFGANSSPGALTFNAGVHTTTSTSHKRALNDLNSFAVTASLSSLSSSSSRASTPPSQSNSRSPSESSSTSTPSVSSSPLSLSSYATLSPTLSAIDEEVENGSLSSSSSSPTNTSSVSGQKSIHSLSAPGGAIVLNDHFSSEKSVHAEQPSSDDAIVSSLFSAASTTQQLCATSLSSSFLSPSSSMSIAPVTFVAPAHSPRSVANVNNTTSTSASSPPTSTSLSAAKRLSSSFLPPSSSSSASSSFSSPSRCSCCRLLLSASEHFYQCCHEECSITLCQECAQLGIHNRNHILLMLVAQQYMPTTAEYDCGTSSSLLTASSGTGDNASYEQLVWHALKHYLFCSQHGWQARKTQRNVLSSSPSLPGANSASLPPTDEEKYDGVVKTATSHINSNIAANEGTIPQQPSAELNAFLAPSAFPSPQPFVTFPHIIHNTNDIAPTTTAFSHTTFTCVGCKHSIATLPSYYICLVCPQLYYCDSCHHAHCIQQLSSLLSSSSPSPASSSSALLLCGAINQDSMHVGSPANNCAPNFGASLVLKHDYNHPMLYIPITNNTQFNSYVAELLSISSTIYHTYVHSHHQQLLLQYQHLYQQYTSVHSHLLSLQLEAEKQQQQRPSNTTALTSLRQSLSSLDSVELKRLRSEVVLLLKQMEEQQENMDSCQICFSVTANAITLPCTHHILCTTCANHLLQQSKGCPRCNANIESVIAPKP